MNTINSLVIDDDQNILLILRNILDEKKGLTINSALSEIEAKELLGKKKYEIIFLDLILEETKGEDLIEFIINKQPTAKIIVLTGRKDIQIAAECLQKGAYDFIEKPILPAILLNTYSHLEKVLHSNKNSLNIKSKSKNKDIENYARDLIIGSDPVTLKIINEAYQISDTDYNILIQGPTGCGKELFAEYIHRCSNRNGPFIKINIAGVDDNFFSDTLFGHKRESYTGANTELKGIVAEAENGTILLDEIGDLPLNSQVKLLRLIQFGEYYPIGSNKPHYTKTRFLFATNIELDKKVKAGTFREDLYYRIMAHQVKIKPLQERKESIEELVYFFIAKECKANKKQMFIPSQEYIDKLKKYNFPGNIRELEFIIKNSMIKTDSKYLQATDINFNEDSALNYASSSFSEMIKSLPDISLPSLKELTDQYINEILFRNNGNQTKTAKSLGITQQALSQRLKKGKV